MLGFQRFKEWWKKMIVEGHTSYGLLKDSIGQKQRSNNRTKDEFEAEGQRRNPVW